MNCKKKKKMKEDCYTTFPSFNFKSKFPHSCVWLGKEREKKGGDCVKRCSDSRSVCWARHFEFPRKTTLWNTLPFALLLMLIRTKSPILCCHHCVVGSGVAELLLKASKPLSCYWFNSPHFNLSDTLQLQSKVLDGERELGGELRHDSCPLVLSSRKAEPVCIQEKSQCSELRVR